MSYPRHFLLKLAFYSVAIIAPLFFINALIWTINTDFIVYAVGLKTFSAQLWSGDLYPRWLLEANAGLGSPMFLFYGPLPFYVGALLEPFAALDPGGYARVIATFIPAIFLAGITSYRWLRLHFEEKLAAQGALIYTTFPYTILCIYFSFGLAHMWAIALMPLVLKAAWCLAHKGFSALWKLALAYALLALTHLPTTVVFAAIPCFYVFFLKGSRRACLAVAAGVYGAALAAVYLLPAFVNRPFVTSEHFLDGQLVYDQNFYHIRFGHGLFIILLPLIGFFVELPKTLKWSQAALTKFWLIVTGVLFFMTTQLSLPLWHALPPLQHLQFPFRFFTAMLPGVVFIAISWLPHVKSKEFYGFFSLIALIIFSCFSYNDYFWISDKYTRTIDRYNIVIAPEYRTPWTEKAGLKNPRELPESYTDMPSAKLASGIGTVEITAQTPRSITLHAEISSPTALVELKRFYFPGWQAEGLEISEHDALLAVSLAKGKHDITLRQPWFAGEREGLMISLIALFTLLFLWFKSKKQEQHV